MSILTDRTILDCLKTGDIVIDPFDKKQLNPNSYDVRLGESFYLVDWGYGCDHPTFHGPVDIPVGQRVHIPKGGTLLGRTIEVIGTHNCIVAEIRAKSTTRRTGFSAVADAGWADIGYENPFTVELTALIGSGSPSLVVGQPFAQMIFFSASAEPLIPYAGQYTVSEWPKCMIPRAYRGTDAVRPACDAVVECLKHGWKD